MDERPKLVIYAEDVEMDVHETISSRFPQIDTRVEKKAEEFVEAARSIGVSTGRIVFRHLVPNTLGVIVVFSTLRIPTFIMLESFLSFLGLGVQAPYASWGSLVSDGVEGMNLYPWRLFFPAVAMVVFLFAMNFLGDGLRDALDPQSKNKL